MVMWKIIPSNDHKQVQVYFPFNAWLGKKASTLKTKKDAYSPPDHHPRGDLIFQKSLFFAILISRTDMLPCCS